MALVGFLVAGGHRNVKLSHWQVMKGPRPPQGFECDGCSNSPDFTADGIQLWVAGVVHDYRYRVKHGQEARNWRVRWKVDGEFRENIRTIMLLQGAGRGRARRLAWLYWGRVRIWGASSFQHWDKGEQPQSKFRLFQEAYGLWKVKDAPEA